MRTAAFFFIAACSLAYEGHARRVRPAEEQRRTAPVEEAIPNEGPLKAFDEVPKLEEQAALFAEELSATMEDQRVQEKVERAAEPLQAIMEDEEFRKIRDQMKAIMADPEASEQQMQLAAEQLKDLMADPNVQAQARLFAEQLESMMSDASFKEHAGLLAERMKVMTENSKEHDSFLDERMKVVVGDPGRAVQIIDEMKPSRSCPSEAFEKFLLAETPAAFAPAVVKALRKHGPAKRTNPTMAVKIGKSFVIDDMGQLDLKSIDTSPTPKLLSQVEKLKLLSTLSEAGLLTYAEKQGFFSWVEKQGLLSTAEKALPLVEKFGLLSFLQGVIETEAGVLFAGATLLTGAAPAYIALDYLDIVPGPEGAFVPLAVLAGVTTTAGGAALWALAYAVSLLQKEIVD